MSTMQQKRFCFHDAVARTTVGSIRNELVNLHPRSVALQHLGHDRVDIAALRRARMMLEIMEKANGIMMTIFSDETWFSQTSHCGWFEFDRGQGIGLLLGPTWKLSQGRMVGSDCAEYQVAVYVGQSRRRRIRRLSGVRGSWRYATPCASGEVGGLCTRAPQPTRLEPQWVLCPG